MMIVIISFMTIFTLENVDDGTIFTVALPCGDGETDTVD
jgi:hypothetical protein